MNALETAYYHFPQADFDKFFSVRAISDSVKDKLVADGAASTPKGVFTDKIRVKMEEAMRKIDLAACPGMRG